jgi:hypothetical protein
MPRSCFCLSLRICKIYFTLPSRLAGRGVRSTHRKLDFSLYNTDLLYNAALASPHEQSIEIARDLLQGRVHRALNFTIANLNGTILSRTSAWELRFTDESWPLYPLFLSSHPAFIYPYSVPGEMRLSVERYHPFHAARCPSPNGDHRGASHPRTRRIPRAPHPSRPDADRSLLNRSQTPRGRPLTRGPRLSPLPRPARGPCLSRRARTRRSRASSTASSRTRSPVSLMSRRRGGRARRSSR